MSKRASVYMAVIVFAGACAVVVGILLTTGGGRSRSYQFGFREGQSIVGDRRLPYGSPTLVTQSCVQAFDSLPHLPGASISNAKTEVKVSDLKRGDYVAGCRAGILSAAGY